MKNLKTKLKIGIIGINLLSINLFAQDYIYKGVKNVEATIGKTQDESSDETVSADCYDPLNIGKIGTAQGCNELLIVDNTILRDLVAGNTYTTGTKTISSYADNVIFTGQVTDMSFLFEQYNNTIEKISNWETSNVIYMNSLFRETSFNQDISKWNVKNVTRMNAMFYNNPTFNQPLNNWDVSSVESFNSMFLEATVFNQPLDNWDVSQINYHGYMTSMFSSSNFNQNISNWCVEKISEKPNNFDSYSGFSGKKELQPEWGEPCS